jgi:chemotaxis protein methyltransferase CheR
MPTMTDLEYTQLKQTILKATGLDIDAYKTQQMQRRLTGFVEKCDTPDVVSYCQMLRNNPQVRRQLLDFLAINVSEYFRDTSQFDNLRNKILPELLKRSPRLNIWSSACSCGQEPFSLVMILNELTPHVSHRILGTDLDDAALKKARDGGPYPAEEIKNVSVKLRQQYFRQTGDGWWIDPEVVKKVRFQKKNLLAEPFDKGYDLVACRNVIIYFSDTVRDTLFQKFHDSLKANGILFLGSSEVIMRPKEAKFQMAGPSFYRKEPAQELSASMV